MLARADLQLETAVMGSRASSLLREEDIEEIKKETGCEY